VIQLQDSLCSFRPLNSGDCSPEDDNEASATSLSGLSALTAAYTPKDAKPKLEMTERRRSKLRDIEVRHSLLLVIKYSGV